MADPPRRRMSAAERRGELLNAASEVFGRSGYHGASLDEIAAVAGVSKALIYEHFASKRELHAELVEQHAGEIFRRLAASAEAGERTGRSGCAEASTRSSASSRRTATPGGRCFATPPTPRSPTRFRASASRPRASSPG